MSRKVKKAVIPAAGFGTRFLPITKSVCKEMLPIVDKPTLQYIVEEAVAAGIEDILVITGRNKKILEDFFDYTPELDYLLEKEWKEEFLAISRRMEKMANLYFVRQKHPCGFADAILYAKPFTGDDPFAILLGDDISDDDIATLASTPIRYRIDTNGATATGITVIPATTGSVDDRAHRQAARLEAFTSF